MQDLVDRKIKEILSDPGLLKKIKPNRDTVYRLRNEDRKVVSFEKKLGFLARAGYLIIKE
jgi:hypothetical protein